MTGYAHRSHVIGASLVAQLVKNPPAIQETCVLSLGWEDSPGEKLPNPVLVWRILWTILSMGSQRVRQD